MSEPQTAKQPNLLFIMPDQLRADFLSCYGATFIHTPHIDSIAEEGCATSVPILLRRYVCQRERRS